MAEGLKMIFFRAISNVGEARPSYTETTQKAKQGGSKGVRECIRASQKMFLAGHEAHSELIQREAQGERVSGPTILVHAEDQLMSAEGFRIIAEEMFASYERIVEPEKGLGSR